MTQEMNEHMKRNWISASGALAMARALVEGWNGERFGAHEGTLFPTSSVENGILSYQGGGGSFSDRVNITRDLSGIPDEWMMQVRFRSDGDIAGIHWEFAVLGSSGFDRAIPVNDFHVIFSGTGGGISSPQLNPYLGGSGVAMPNGALRSANVIDVTWTNMVDTNDGFAIDFDS